MREVGQSFIAYSDIDTNKFYVVDFGMSQIARIKALGIQTISSKYPFKIKNPSSLSETIIPLLTISTSFFGLQETAN